MKAILEMPEGDWKQELSAPPGVKFAVQVAVKEERSKAGGKTFSLTAILYCKNS